MNILSGLSKILIVTVTAAFFTLGYASMSILQPLSQPAMLAPANTQLAGSTMAPSVTSQPPTLTPTPTQTFTKTITPSLTFTQIPSETASPSPSPSSPNPVQIGFLSVGRGDAILIIAPDGRTMLIDGGPHGSGITGILKRLGIQQIDVMVATHPHQDHVGGLSDVLRAFPVKQLYTNGESLEDDATYRNFQASVLAAGLKEKHVENGDTIRLGELTFQVLNPASRKRLDINQNSMVLWFSFQGMTVLLMSDADHFTESDILKAELPVKADILKLGHHGSAQSSSKAFLEAVSPAIAIYSSSSGSKSGFPDKAALDRVRKLGIKIFGTDKNGSIFVTSDLNGFTIETSKGVKK